MTRAGQDPNASGTWLVSHGLENVALGGPSTRIRQIQQYANDAGYAMQSTSDVSQILKSQSNPDLVHIFNSWGLRSGLNALALARRSRVPIVFSPIMLNLSTLPFYDAGVKSLLHGSTSSKQVAEGAALIHALTPQWNPHAEHPPRQGVPNHYDVLRRQTSLADRIICLSAYERNLLVSIGVEDKKIAIVPNGVDTATMSGGDKNAFIEKYGIRDFVLMVGRIESRKNQALTAFALRELDCPIVCIGHVGDPDYFEQLKRWSGRRFVHIDRISDRNLLASAYKAASVVILASWGEGAPLVALEAAAAGTPLVLSTLSSEQEYFHEHAKYVHPADLPSILNAVEPFITNPEVDALRAERSRFAQRQFDISRHVDLTLKQYALAKEQAVSTPRRQTQASDLDATFLAHELHTGRPLTGSAIVENELGQAILQAQETATVSVWSARSRQFHAVPRGDFHAARMGEYASMRASTSGDADGLCESVELTLKTRGLLFSKPFKRRGPGLRRRAFTLLKYTMDALPEPARQQMIGFVSRKRPGFSLDVLPEHRLFERARSERSLSSEIIEQSDGIHIQANMRCVPKAEREEWPEHIQVIVLGHAWISNDMYLDDLTERLARHRSPLVILIPDILYVTRPNTFDAETAKTFQRRLKRAIELADTIVTVSNDSAADIRAFASEHDLERKIVRVTLGVPNLEHLDSRTPPKRQVEGPYVLYVSSMSERKRHDFLIDAWRSARASGKGMSDAKLVLVGRPLTGYERFANKRYKRKLMADNIIVLNDCDQDDLSALYQGAAFTVYPSAAEGWGIPPIESLAAGKPCLVSDSLPVANDIASAGLVSVPTHSERRWSEAIRTWLIEPQTLERATEAAENFKPPSWSKAADTVLSS